MNKVKILKDFNSEKWEFKNKHMVEVTGGGNANPWPLYSKELDSDYKKVLEKYLPGENLNICDVGTCAGWQSIELAKLGHRVVGTDISDTALGEALYHSQSLYYLDLRFIKDDILSSTLDSGQFDFITDRACFHSFYGYDVEGISKIYINTIKRLLKPNGIFLIKGMSIDEKRFITKESDKIPGLGMPSAMPYRFKSEEFANIFGKDMNLVESWRSVIQSENINPPAIAEVAVFRNVGDV